MLRLPTKYSSCAVIDQPTKYIQTQQPEHVLYIFIVLGLSFIQKKGRKNIFKDYR